MTKMIKMINRYEAAVRWELARQIVRECKNYGFPVTLTDVAEVHAAERQYDRATRTA
jgi:hypothetical protein